MQQCIDLGGLQLKIKCSCSISCNTDWWKTTLASELEISFGTFEQSNIKRDNEIMEYRHITIVPGQQAYSTEVRASSGRWRKEKVSKEIHQIRTSYTGTHNGSLVSEKQDQDEAQFSTVKRKKTVQAMETWATITQVTSFDALFRRKHWRGTVHDGCTSSQLSLSTRSNSCLGPQEKWISIW